MDFNQNTIWDLTLCHFVRSKLWNSTNNMLGFNQHKHSVQVVEWSFTVKNHPNLFFHKNNTTNHTNHRDSTNPKGDAPGPKKGLTSTISCWGRL